MQLDILAVSSRSRRDSDKGFERMAEAITTQTKKAMKLERAEAKSQQDGYHRRTHMP